MLDRAADLIVAILFFEDRNSVVFQEDLELKSDLAVVLQSKLMSKESKNFRKRRRGLQNQVEMLLDYGLNFVNLERSLEMITIHFDIFDALT